MSKSKRVSSLIDESGKVRQLETYELRIVLALLEAEDTNIESLTPIEYFVVRVVRRYAGNLFHHSTPGTLKAWNEFIQEALVDFEQHSQYKRDEANELVRLHRDLVDAAIAEADAEQAETQAQRKPAASQTQPSNVKEMSA